VSWELLAPPGLEKELSSIIAQFERKIKGRSQKREIFSERWEGAGENFQNRTGKIQMTENYSVKMKLEKKILQISKKHLQF
jgi:hypothetical protein